MPLPDEKFLSALADVVWRFHAYEQYDQDAGKAIQALKKRVPGYPTELYPEQFQLHLELLLATIGAVREATIRLKPENKHSQYTDVDQEYAIRKLRAMFPDQEHDYLKGYLDMVIYWYYLR